MPTINFVLSGLGGQGILFMTKIIAKTALRKGYSVMGAETHGMAQRGGSVISHLRLGKVSSSLVKPGSAQFLLSLEENEAYRNLSFLAKNGHLFSDTAMETFPVPGVKSYLDKMGIRYDALPAGNIALELGAPVSSNLAMIGFFAAFRKGPFEVNDFRETIESISPERFKAINLQVFEKGLSAGNSAKASRGSIAEANS
jgi:indolepyruvate ferredoxin oxidoreductase beta subunit